MGYQDITQVVLGNSPTSVNLEGLRRLIDTLHELYYHKRRKVVSTSFSTGQTLICIMETKKFKRLGVKK